MRPGTATARPPPAEAIRRFVESAERYGYRTATAEENAEVGIHLS